MSAIQQLLEKFKPHEFSTSNMLNYPHEVSDFMISGVSIKGILSELIEMQLKIEELEKKLYSD